MIENVRTGATVWTNQDAYVARPPAAPVEPSPPVVDVGGPGTTGLARRRRPGVTTWLRLAIGLIWLIGLVSHLRGAGAHPCTCPHA